MNKKDRKEITGIIHDLEDLKEQTLEIATRLRDLADAEREKFDNMSEGLQGSEKGQAIETAADSLSEAADACDNANVGEAVDALAGLDL